MSDNEKLPEPASSKREHEIIQSLEFPEKNLLISAVHVMGEQEGPYCDINTLPYFRVKYLINCLAKAGPRMTPAACARAWTIIDKLSSTEGD